MKYNFDKVYDRRYSKYSYSTKWGVSPDIASLCNSNGINKDTIAIFTADMDFKTAEPIIEAMHKVADFGMMGYSMVLPGDDYHKAIKQWFKKRENFEINDEEMSYCNGTVEALRKVIQHLTNPDEGIIISRPVYGPFEASILKGKRKLIDNNMICDDNLYYTLDFDDLEKKCSDPKNTMYILCNPQNPTGRIFQKEELIRLIDICQKNNVILVADEIHGDLIRREEKFTHVYQVTDNYTGIVTFTAINKTFNLAGLRGTTIIIKDKDLREEFIKKNGRKSPSPFTIAATIAAYNEGEEWLEQLITYLDDNIDYVIKFLKDNMPKVKVRRPEGTYFLWLDFSGYGLESEDIKDRIANKANVLLEGGELFDHENGAQFMRVCVPSPRSVLKEAFERIAKEF